MLVLREIDRTKSEEFDAVMNLYNEWASIIANVIVISTGRRQNLNVLCSGKALRVIPRGKHGWRFTARAKCATGKFVFSVKRIIWGRRALQLGKISRLTLQNSLRMFPDLKKGYSFTLVVSNLKIYSSGKSYQWVKVFHDTGKVDFFYFLWLFAELSKTLLGCF